MATEHVIVRVIQRIHASPGQTFNAWIDPQWLAKWMFGPAIREEEILHLNVDPRIDGAFSFLVRRGGQEIDHIGTYRVLDRPSRLVFTWSVAGTPGEPSLVMVDIPPHEFGGCDCILTHEVPGEWADYAPRIEESWRKMLAALANALLDS
ncbi:SRPBCC family protein [Planctomicrobium piriforme]|uniref:Uncharacterized conserved protein YndB, AHSA1/START domain n=1 Tax=Planctomicrobium piriforme TaxID=1576369 RepID=A0A1I3PI31_9PLAN|nr:SRPBCC family protein [Planctomicrobium piriforme]SFJ21314.1 Uncharacterized conserved protein YndB, AHSA1/START domain [Planctomicrobium piriforme]